MIEDGKLNQIHEWVYLYIPEFFLCRCVDVRRVDRGYSSAVHLSITYMITWLRLS
jgi:hypothetical protein